MAIKLEMLRCFITVAHSGKLSDAAQSLGRTPSAVSMMLKQFEEHLGQPLFESERKSKLTALGEFTLTEATRTVEHFDHSVAMIKSFARSETGLVRIAAVPSVAGAILPKVMKHFLDEHPNVSVDIRDMDSAGIHRELEKERIDIGIATNFGVSSEITGELLFSDDFGIVCPVDHPLTKKEDALSWEDIETDTFIANGLCDQIQNDVFQQKLSGSKLMVRNTTSLLALIQEGVGVTVLPRLVVGTQNKKISFLPIASPRLHRSIDILHRADCHLSPASQKFKEFLRNTSDKISSPFNEK